MHISGMPQDDEFLQLIKERIDFSTVQLADSGDVIYNWNNRWTARGHQMSEIMMTRDRRFAYINIPKNYSSSIKDALSATGEWEIYSLHDIDLIKTRFIVPLRDPINRWISGMSEYLTMYHSQAIDDISREDGLGALPLIGQRLGLSLIFDQMTFDDHTDLQLSFLKGLSLTKCNFFFLDKNTESAINKFFVENGLLPITLGNENSTDGDDGNAKRKKSCSSVLQMIIENNPHRYRQLLVHLYPDINLINNVKFNT